MQQFKLVFTHLSLVRQDHSRLSSCQLPCTSAHRLDTACIYSQTIIAHCAYIPYVKCVVVFSFFPPIVICITGKGP